MMSKTQAECVFRNLLGPNPTSQFDAILGIIESQICTFYHISSISTIFARFHVFSLETVFLGANRPGGGAVEDLAQPLIQSQSPRRGSAGLIMIGAGN